MRYSVYIWRLEPEYAWQPVESFDVLFAAEMRAYYWFSEEGYQAEVQDNQTKQIVFRNYTCVV